MFPTELLDALVRSRRERMEPWVRSVCERLEPRVRRVRERLHARCAASARAFVLECALRPCACLERLAAALPSARVISTVVYEPEQGASVEQTTRICPRSCGS